MSADAINWPALLALEKKATAGPWKAYGCAFEDSGYELGEAWDDTNAAFIAASRQAVPALVAMVRGLARALDDAAHRFGEIFEAARGEFIQSAATNGEQAALMALATIPAALRAGVGDDA